MKLENFNEVTKLIQIRRNVMGALSQIGEFVEKSKDRGDGDCVEDAQGYACYLHMHTDGSGPGIDMSGCYVGVEAAQALTAVLDGKLNNVDAALEKLGVDVNIQT